jgi:hypothetical protein
MPSLHSSQSSSVRLYKRSTSCKMRQRIDYNSCTVKPTSSHICWTLGSLVKAFPLELEDQLLECPIDDLAPVYDRRREAIYTQYTAYVTSTAKEKDIMLFGLKMLKKRSKTALQHWMSDGLVWPELSKICVKLISMVTTSAASERNFTTMGFIHSKLRSRLTRHARSRR